MRNPSLPGREGGWAPGLGPGAWGLGPMDTWALAPGGSEPRTGSYKFATTGQGRHCGRLEATSQELRSEGSAVSAVFI
ncbi:hypothetical protein SARC_05724 [Sphaeroforma arctica JP610]|uniref:Uncharacterized protein n=1 Tax=Sphaeroforma arctica JP610 TaxID=667725 RepID=A0A0L0FYR6_9EUKA|nr:hypothetical protein SARC_05724 [Sphaeroforma arctica JP610]KNC81975.1 hypothetical protein SARC_05724 [Sphaeroforma arctica JP610]|eukprot:XP_014155877.1 hypothetical protein SARC_05724 [Sphaeroforma arctica JP610]